MKEKFSLKDHLFNAPKIAFLADSIQKVYPTFEKSNFEQNVLKLFPQLELKARIAHIRTCLKAHLPADYTEAVQILLASLPAPLSESLSDDDFGDFIYAPYSDFVAYYGCTEAHLSFSLNALKAITQRFSAEDAIRYFINAHPTSTLNTLMEWATDKNYHVRRLCSEGTRPKLPWSQQIRMKPEAALPILHQLFADKTRYVTRSVANHLNDLSKINPDLVFDTLAAWRSSGKQQTVEMNFIVKHALRTLVKAAHLKVFLFLEIGDSAGISLSEVLYNKIVKIGDFLEFSFEINAVSAKNLVIDYVLHFQSRRGILSNQKVFKLQTVAVNPNRPVTIQKRHCFKADMTTRKWYPGMHKIELQLNGNRLAQFEFELVE
jgi:3-methyladenine DNA glycosylase AlkC